MCLWPQSSKLVNLLHNPVLVAYIIHKFANGKSIWGIKCLDQVLLASHLQRWGLSLRPLWWQLSAVVLQRHWHDIGSSAHFLPRHGVHCGRGAVVCTGTAVEGVEGGEVGQVLGTGAAVVTSLGDSVAFCLDLSLSFFLCLLVSFTRDLVAGVVWNCSFNLHSHWLCSTNGSSTSSCFIKEVLISSMVSVCVSEGTHSKASSAQQPPHLRTDTQDGTNRWCVSSGNSRQTSTKVSRGSQPLREYTSNHRRTSCPSHDMGESDWGKCASFAWDVGILVSSRNWNIPRITWSIIPIVQQSKGHAKIFLGQSKIPAQENGGLSVASEISCFHSPVSLPGNDTQGGIFSFRRITLSCCIKISSQPW